MSKNNTGENNSGDGNTGDGNSGNWNSGDRNSGNWNSGDGNTGDGNSGYRNSGNWNSGDWNTGDRNSGFLNTDEPTIRMFNKDTGLGREEITFPVYFFFSLTEWIREEDMTEEEKEVNDQYKVTGGYLKVFEYKEAWRMAWDNATDEDRRKTLRLPNWDNDIFLEITGIDVEKELKVTQGAGVSIGEVTVNGKKYRLVE